VSEPQFALNVVQMLRLPNPLFSRRKFSRGGRSSFGTAPALAGGATRRLRHGAAARRAAATGAGRARQRDILPQYSLAGGMGYTFKQGWKGPPFQRG
jgi:hypothetical protein